MRRISVKTVWLRLEQAPIILTVIIATFATIASSIFQMEVKAQLSLVLTVIGFMAISELIEKHRNTRRIADDVMKTRALIEKQAGRVVSADTFFEEGKTPIGPFVENASEICLMGASLMGASGQLFNALRASPKENIHVRAIVIKTDDQVLTTAAYRNGDGESIETWKLYLGLARKNLEYLKDHLGANSSLEARTIVYPPAYTISMFDADTDNGTIIVELWPHHSIQVPKRPKFILKPDRDAKWYEHFKNQFEITWENAEKWL